MAKIRNRLKAIRSPFTTKPYRMDSITGTLNPIDLKGKSNQCNRIDLSLED